MGDHSDMPAGGWSLVISMRCVSRIRGFPGVEAGTDLDQTILILVFLTGTTLLLLAWPALRSPERCVLGLERLQPRKQSRELVLRDLKLLMIEAECRRPLQAGARISGQVQVDSRLQHGRGKGGICGALAVQGRFL